MKSIEEKLEVLAEIAKLFNEAKFTWALGASSMLYFNRIASEFNDIDIMIDDKDAPNAKQLLMSLGTLIDTVPGVNYRTKHFYEFTIDGVEVDIMGGFAIYKDGIVHDCSLKQTDIASYEQVNGQLVPLNSVYVWRGYYELMGRDAKVALIDAFLAKNSTTEE